MDADRVVVTGASGYLGQHLVPRLVRDGWAVTALGRRPPGDLPSSVTSVRGDVTDFGSLTPHIQNVDAVVHLACLPLQPSGLDPRAAFSVNALGTFNVLEACRAAGVPRVVVASTAYVYGRPLEVPITEHHPTIPTNPYGASKLAGDAFALAYETCQPMQTVVLRIFNVFGGAANGAPRPTVDWTFRQKARAGLPVTIHGNPDDAHDFVHVLDVVDALVSALSPPAAGVYNIGSGRNHTLRDLALAAGVAGNLIHASGGEDPPVLRRADISRAMKELGFRPRLDVLDYVASPQGSDDSG